MSSLIVIIIYNYFLDSLKDINVFLKIKRKSKQESYNEYIPTGFISNGLYSQTAKTIYWMPKINTNSEWSDNLDFDFNVQVEFLKSQQYSSSSSMFGNYKFPDENGMHVYINTNQGNSNQSSSNQGNIPSDTGNKYGSVTNTQSK